jgi:Peptidase A4 family
VSCATRRSGDAAFWVGLGGAADTSHTSQALEQIGTEADCRAGKPASSMWYELVPALSVRVNYKIFPGNVVTASVKVKGSQVSLQIRNLTRRTNFIKKLRVTAPDLSSAEWIAEAPSSCDSRGGCIPLPLANFGTVSFTHALATVAGHTGTILDPGWSPTALELIEESGRFAMRALPTRRKRALQRRGVLRGRVAGCDHPARPGRLNRLEPAAGFGVGG